LPGLGSSAPSVSVILIVKNGARFIADALESVRAQSHPPAEILVVDGHSTDATAAIARRYDGVTVVPQASAGIANAYNEGIARARHDLLAFISHDDRWLPTKLERQVTCLTMRPDVLVCVTHVQHVLHDGAAPPSGFRTELLAAPVPGFIMETVMARRSVFERVGYFDPAFPVSEDTEWFSRMRDAGVPTVVLPEALVEKRVHETNASLGHAGINGLLLKALRQSIVRKRSAGEQA
jgi:glycosyltransferase involved in cell wall biosynthesis